MIVTTVQKVPLWGLKNTYVFPALSQCTLPGLCIWTLSGGSLFLTEPSFIGNSLSRVTRRGSPPKIFFRVVPAWLCGYVEKRLDKKAKVNFKIYNVTDWTINNYTNKYIYCPIWKGNQKMKFGHLIEYIIRNTLIEKS